MLSVEAILTLQRSAGNRSVARLMAPVVQRFPIPTKDDLERDAGYRGGKHKKGTWSALGNSLLTNANAPSAATVQDVQQRARAAEATFDEKKRKKVGEEETKRILAQLERVITDCEIQLLLFEITELGTKPRTMEGVQDRERRIKRIRMLMASTVDTDGTLAEVIGKADQDVRTDVSAELITLLKALDYAPQGNFWYPSGNQFSYQLPHVDWKAHIACASAGQALDVVRNASSALVKMGVQHKVDINPEMFVRTEKLITIYPPPPTTEWATVIAALEQAVGGQLKVPPGEIPVGVAGKVGMRHGQITGLSTEVLESEAQTKFIDSGKKVDGFRIATLVPLGSARPLAVERTDPPSHLVIRDRVLYFWYPETETSKSKAYPAIVLNGVIKPDPRLSPNPFNVPLPKDVTQHRGW